MIYTLYYFFGSYMQIIGSNICVYDYPHVYEGILQFSAVNKKQNILRVMEAEIKDNKVQVCIKFGNITAITNNYDEAIEYLLIFLME